MKQKENSSSLQTCTHEVMKNLDVTNKINFFCFSCGAISFEKVTFYLTELKTLKEFWNKIGY